MKKKKAAKREKEEGLFYVVTGDGAVVAEQVDSMPDAMRYAESHVIMETDEPVYILKAVKELTIDIKVTDMT